MARQMYSCRIEGQGHIEAVINQQRHAIGGESCLEACPQGVEVAGTEILLTQLDSPSATACRRRNHLLEGTPGRLVAIGHHIDAEIDTGCLRCHASSSKVSSRRGDRGTYEPIIPSSGLLAVAYSL